MLATPILAGAQCFLTMTATLKTGHFCPLELISVHRCSLSLLSKWGSPATFVKALVYLTHGYKRIGFTRASTYLNASLAALDSQNLRESQIVVKGSSVVACSLALKASVIVAHTTRLPETESAERGSRTTRFSTCSHCILLGFPSLSLYISLVAYPGYVSVLLHAFS
jgi:hypothetical protein